MKFTIVLHAVFGSIWCLIIVPYIWGWKATPGCLAIYTAGAFCLFLARKVRDAWQCRMTWHLHKWERWQEDGRKSVTFWSWPENKRIPKETVLVQTRLCAVCGIKKSRQIGL